MCAGSVNMKYKYNLVANYIYPMIGCMIVKKKPKKLPGHVGQTLFRELRRC